MPLRPDVAAFLESQKGLPPRSSLTVEQTRAAYRRAAALAGTPPEPAAVQDGSLPSGARFRRYTPSGAAAGALVLYFHGGRFFSGDLDTHDPVCRCLTLACGCELAAIDYRLGPEHRFPAAVEDAFDAVRWAASQAGRVAVAGDSAGANLAAVAALSARDRGGPKLAAQLLVYPMIDALCAEDSHREFASGYGPGSEDMRRGWREYLPEGADPKHPYASPRWAQDLAGLPPALVITAECDSLRDEGEIYARRLQEAGVAVTLRRYEGVTHGFFQYGGVIQAGREAIREAGAWLRAALAAP